MITALYGGILGCMFMWLSLAVIKKRRSLRISLGYGENNEIANEVSGHSNFAAYTSMILLLLFILEQSGQIHAAILHLGGIIFTLGRFLHATAFTGEKMNFKTRVLGMHLTLWPLLVLSLLCLYTFAAKTLLS